MAMSMKASTSRVKFKAKVSTNGNLGSSMKASGKMGTKKGMVFGKDLRMTHMLGNGGRINRTGLESIYGGTETSTKVNGKHAWDMDKEAIGLPVVINMWESTCGARLKGMDSISGLMDTRIVDSFSTARRRAKDTGWRAEMQRVTSIQVSTRTTKSMDTVNSCGVQVADTKDTTSMTLRKATVRCTGLTAAYTEGSGKMAYNVDSAWWYSKMACGKPDSLKIIFIKRRCHQPRSSRITAEEFNKPIHKKRYQRPSDKK
jgi:hypothetical protein